MGLIAYNNKLKRSHVTNLAEHVKNLKQKEITPKWSRWQEIIKFRTMTNKIEKQPKMIQRICELEIWFFNKMSLKLINH